MTAIEIWREDRAARRGPEGRRSRQEYFILLRDALHEELAAEGRSDFLEEMIASGGAELPALEFAALRECFAAIVDGRRMKDASQHVPHILRAENTPLTWADMEKGPAFRVNDPRMPEMLLRLRNVSYQLVSARDQTPAVDAERAVNREIAGLRAVSRALEEDNRSLRAERDALRERIAQLEEGVITRQLQNKADARRFQLEDELQREMAEKRAAAERELQEALARAAQEEQRAREDACRAAGEADARRAAAYEALQTALQTSLAAQLQEMQTALRAEDLRFLAQSYAALSGTVSRDFPALVGTAQRHGADETLLQQLAALSGGVSAHLTRMEKALQQLGLTVVHPAEGDMFDGALHSPASAAGDDAPEGERAIAAAESPAVRFVHADGTAQTLVRAVVHTRRSDAGREKNETN